MSQLKQTASISFAPPVGNQTGLPGGFGGGLVTITPCPGGNCVDPDEEEENPS